MKKILTLIAAVAACIATLQAEVLLNEHFDRSLGTLSASTWSSGSVPNDSNWHTYSPGTVQFQVVSQQLQYSDYCSATSGKAVQYSANHSRDYILFPQALNGSDGDKAYMAFLINASSLQTTSSAQSTSNANNSILSFAINASNNALGSLNGRIIIRTVDANTYQLGVSRRGEAPQFAENQLQTGTTYLIVAEYAFIAGEKNDVVTLYINPTPSVQTASVSSVNPSTASADTEVIVGAALCSNGNTPTGMLIDEIRVATSWDDLWEDSSAPTPAIHGESSLDFGKVATGEAAQKSVRIQGENLQSGISVSSDNAALVPAVSTIAQADAEAGYELQLTLTATQEGTGSANLTLSTSGASDLVIAVSWNASKPVPPAGSELLLNGSFESYSCNAMFGCSFDDWNLPLGNATAETSDKIDGEAAISIHPTASATLDQGVMLTDADYTAGTLFELTLNYKIVSLPEGSEIGLDCYWEPSGSGDAEAMKAHDAEVLQRPIADGVSSGWERLTVITSKPALSSYFRVRVKVPKNASVLLDSCSLVQTENSQALITVTPSVLPVFDVTAGQTETKTFTVKSFNCTDYIYLTVNHLTGAAFTIDASMISPNSPREVEVRFAPQEAGSYRSTVTIASTGAESVVLTLEGTASPAGGEAEWQTEFSWDLTAPLTRMDEHFDDAIHNKPLLLNGWQNVAAADARPWWGFDEAKTSPVRGDGRFAKATAYQWAQETTGEWEMWLVTPALDYKNTANKVFAFSVMGEYMAEEGNQARLEVYYIDPLGEPTALFQDLTGSFSIPSTSDENEQWVTFLLDLTPYAETVADVFHMAFRYVGPNGAEGAVTYYIDDVTWGIVKSTEGIQQPRTGSQTKKVLRDGKLLIIRDGKEYTILGLPE